MASGLGFEPRLLGPKPSVLPLDDPELRAPLLYLFYHKISNIFNELSDYLDFLLFCAIMYA